MYRLLISGDRANFTTLAFDSQRDTMELLCDYTAPYNASWVERTSSHAECDNFIGISEGEDQGLVYSFRIAHAQKTCHITSEKPTLGAPAHFSMLQDGSALALSTYLGGSVALYPISASDGTGVVLAEAERGEFLFSSPYNSTGCGPNKLRQEKSHAHQVVESRQGLLYVPDLGSDRVWILRRNEVMQEVVGWLQCPPVSGPRHAVFSADERFMYILGELSSKIIAFDLLSESSDGAISSLPGFEASVVPSDIHPDHSAIMDSAEICRNPNIPRVLYASNRNERHPPSQCQKDSPGITLPGDRIAVILLSEDGKQVEDVEYFSTKLDAIRGMRFSNDGKYLAVVGQDGGGIVIYEVSGGRSNDIKEVVTLSAGLGIGIKHVIWL